MLHITLFSLVFTFVLYVFLFNISFPNKLLKELLPVSEERLLNIINSLLSLGHIQKSFKLVVIKPLIKKPQIYI